MGHRRHQELDIFLGVAERLLAIEQAGIGHRGTTRNRGQALEPYLGSVEPLAVRMRSGNFRFQIFIGDDPALFEIDQQHLTWLQPPLGDDALFIDRKHTHLRGHEHHAVIGDQI